MKTIRVQIGRRGKVVSAIILEETNRRFRVRLESGFECWVNKDFRNGVPHIAK